MKHISAESLAAIPDWLGMIETLVEGHRLPPPQISDIFQGNSSTTMLSRAAFVEGLGCGVKTVTVTPDNHQRGLPTVQGAMLFFDSDSGTPVALVDSALITRWKTAADSVLGARLLARAHPKTLTIFGAGAVSDSLAEAYMVQFPTLERVRICNRTAARAEILVQKLRERQIPAVNVPDPQAACTAADIVATATTSHVPILKGDWIEPGTHVDLIGAFKADMREADDTLIASGRLFVDSRETTLDHIGEISIPLENGLIKREDVLADLYDLVGGAPGRISDKDITIFKNGGGAHLDLMTARYLIQLVEDR